MKKLFVLTVGLLLVGSLAFAQWDDANSRGLFPFWQTGGSWYTLLVFVNGSEETTDVLYLRFCDTHGNWCSDTTSDMHSIRYREQLVFSTTPTIPTWIPTTAPTGYAMFRVEGGGFIHPYSVIYNDTTGAGYVVPAYNQDTGF